MYIPTFVPDQEIQVMFNESNKKRFTRTFDFWKTDKKQLLRELSINSI